jgi:hypothetical protein
LPTSQFIGGNAVTSLAFVLHEIATSIATTRGFNIAKRINPHSLDDGGVVSNWFGANTEARPIS